MQYFNGTDYDTLYPETTAELAKSLSINGGTVNGPLILNRDPVETMEAVNLNYLNTQLAPINNKLNDIFDLITNSVIKLTTSDNNRYPTMKVSGSWNNYTYLKIKIDGNFSSSGVGKLCIGGSANVLASNSYSSTVVNNWYTFMRFDNVNKNYNNIYFYFGSREYAIHIDTNSTIEVGLETQIASPVSFNGLITIYGLK